MLSCYGDGRAFNVVSPKHASLSSRVASFVFSKKKNYKESFVFHGDARQYNSPLVGLGICELCRSLPGEFKEYHTSLDDLSLVSPKSLDESFEAIKEILAVLEVNKNYISTTVCEPQLGKRGLYPTLSKASNPLKAYRYRDFIALCDGKQDAVGIASKLGLCVSELLEMIKVLLEKGLIREL